MTNGSNEARAANDPPAAKDAAATSPATPAPPAPKSRARRWLSTFVTFAVFYIVATPPLFFSAARTGLVRGVANDERAPGPVDVCIAPARWVYEDSPLKLVLQPWAEFWYDVLLT